MAADEHGHARAIAKLIEGGKPSPRAQIARREPWHRGDRSGALRAGVFGVSDGLVSNTALVTGVAGSGVSHTVILLTGTAGLLAGSFSMAAGEYVSMASQREMYQREISLEAQELEEKPDEERDELVLLYRAKGIPRDEAIRLADRIMADRRVALDTLTREELGLDPTELGSPLSAAISSMADIRRRRAGDHLPVLLRQRHGCADRRHLPRGRGSHRGRGRHRDPERAPGSTVGFAAAPARRRCGPGDLRDRSPDRRACLVAGWNACRRSFGICPRAVMRLCPETATPITECYCARSYGCS
jgi:hypothetical protein